MIKMFNHVLVLTLLAVTALSAAAQAVDVAPQAYDPLQLLQSLDDYPHAERVAYSDEQVIDHVVALGAINKVRGVWQFRESERLSGRLIRYTWQIIDGFTSREVMQELIGRLEQGAEVELLFACQGRACGKSAQWANRVFLQRILYGREDLQADGRRVLRGGSFVGSQRSVRCAFRSWDLPGNCDGNVGFRVVVAPDPVGSFDPVQDML